jgi:hypothetical protein
MVFLPGSIAPPKSLCCPPKRIVNHPLREDDGVGREKAGKFKSKSAESEKSRGLKITTERLALLNKENNFSTFY